jgi:1-acyl-sn-glycerol-3-phosphate acyltransferase
MASGINKILSVILYAILYSYTAVVVLILIFLSWLKAGKLIRALSMTWAKSVFLLMFKRLYITGKENIKKEKKYILVSNHASLFDIVAIISFFPDISWFGHERLTRIPIFGLFLKLTDYVPFREPTIRNTRHMLEQLFEKAKNKSVAIFPEGTRTTDGRIHPFFRGFIYLFRSGDIDILPVTLNGFYVLKPKKRFYIHFGSKLEVIIHKPISKEALANMNDKHIIETVKTVIESAYH